MSKKMLVASSVLVLVLATAVPVYAQTPTPTGSPGFFGQIESFFSGIFHHHGENNQNQTQNPNVTPGSGQEEQGNMMPVPSGQQGYQTMQQRRLSILVQQGKITQAQADAILAELEKVQAELKSWADAQGINESYVLGGPMGMGIGQGERSQQATVSNGQGGFSNQQGQTQQFHPMMRGGQGGGSGFQQGGEGEGQGGFQKGGQGPQGQ